MKTKQILISLLGNSILGLGIAMSSNALLGLDPCVSFSQSISKMYGFKLGSVILCVNIILGIIVYLIKPKNIGLTTIFVILLNKYPVDFFSNYFAHSEYLLINILLVVIGTVFVALGCNIMIDANIGMGIYDAFIFSLADKFNKEYVYIRYFVDASFLLLTFIFKGYIGIGTIIAYVLTGNLIKISKPLVDKVFLGHTKKSGL